jgi:hypothetical protein
MHEQLQDYTMEHGNELRKLNPHRVAPVNWREEAYLLEEPVDKYTLTENMRTAITNTTMMLRSLSSPRSSIVDMERSFEVTELCEYFLGHQGKVAYQVSLMMLMYVGLLAYTQVFVKTIESQVAT